MVYVTIRYEGMTDMAICRGLHLVVRALRDGRIKSTREAGNSSPGVPRVAEANNGAAGVAQEVDDEKVQPQACSSAMGSKDSRGKEHAKAGCMNRRKAADGGEKGMIQLARDAELYNESYKTMLQSPLYWAPSLWRQGIAQCRFILDVFADRVNQSL
ncbi:hypothetical protein K469DRAFT_697446 [Zopfia rhizophila CBS 207.26]|uniref:Uncharacterized protein n=1 Tax=Zopfia rhizophila CBS 207.26 TaxID=1314779 RepID=A0A6A6DHR8_9PEZI|nr:hypothetical protein K469DRAFT_697446 [Zopfia rhizophila CBS 207.26]